MKPKLRNFSAPLSLGVLVLLASGCNRNSAEVQKLFAENQQLRTELERVKHSMAEPSATAADSSNIAAPDLDLPINELWTQRFQDNEFRARQRLADKIVRLTGIVDNISADSISLFGTSKRFGNVRMTVNLNSGYAAKIRTGLASLERDIPVTVQGKFVYERMCLSDATFVDPNTGKSMTSEEIAELARKGRPSPTP